MTLIEWQSKFISDDPTVNEGITRMLIKGVILDSSLNKNNWMVEEEDFKQLAADFVGKGLRMNHGEKISDVLGRVISTEIDQGHAEAKSEWDVGNILPHVHYVAEVATKDDSIIVPLKMHFIDMCSPQVDAHQLLCSACRTPMISKTQKNCDCSEGGLLLKGLEARELSLVASPAFDKTTAVVYSFAAAVDRTLNSSTTFSSNDKIEINKKGLNMSDIDRITRLEASVSALINTLRAAEEEADEEKKEEESTKAEEEAVKVGEEEEEKLKAEEEETKMVPVSKVAEEEEKSEEEDKADKKIEKLEASIRNLVSMMKASKITPETPEDEPADTTHKIPKISNEPVKSEKLKDGFKFPLETGGMKPGKIKASAGRSQGQSTSFTGAALTPQDNEQKAVDEIFGFAASRGTLPMNNDSRIRTIRY